ncbi:hypothetical protein K7G98_11995 [Saccharothrix sp. MB29]|nr:hypothetical protein [Saccharothrix sp. MB29]
MTAAVGDGAGTVVVDLSDVDFFASVGIDVLLRAPRPPAGRARCASSPRLIRRTLTSVGLAHVLDLHDTSPKPSPPPPDPESPTPGPRVVRPGRASQRPGRESQRSGRESRTSRFREFYIRTDRSVRM